MKNLFNINDIEWIIVVDVESIANKSTLKLPENHILSVKGDQLILCFQASKTE